MKNIFKSFLMILSCAMFFTSCMEEAAAPLASAIKLNKQEVAFDGSSAQAQKVSVSADGDWFVLLSADWVEVSPMSGSGNGEVIITVSDNLDEYDELNGPRSTVVNFCYGTDGIAPLTVNQNGEAGLDASRTYKKVTSAAEIVAGGYLIVFDVKGKLNALDPLTSATETTYKYAYASEVTEKDGVITTPNAASSYIFEAVEGGFHISTAGKYLFQDGNGFLATPDKSKAHVWTVTLDENGLATVKNVSFGDRWIQYDTNYGSAGAYTSARDGALLPYLYIDSKPQTDEILDAKNVTVSPRATEAKIKVTSNKTWKVRNHDEWIKSFTPATGEGDGEVVVTFDEWTSTTEDRTASFMILGETTNVVVELKQLKVPAKSDVEELALDTYSAVEGTVVAAGNDGAYVIADETGAVLVYQKNHGRAVGDKVYVEGNVLRSGGYNTNPVQITPMYTKEISKNNPWTYAPKALAGADLDALVGEDAACQEVLVKGRLSVSGKYVNLKVEDASKQGSIKYMLAADYNELNGAYVVVKGYTVGTYNYLNILPYSVEIDETVVIEPMVVTIAEFKAYKNATKYDLFEVTGTITEIDGKNITIQAGSDELVISDIKNAPAGLLVGDILTVVGNQGENQMVNGVYKSHRNAPELSFTATATVPADATTYSLEILSNVDWTATASEGVTLEPASGKGNATVILTFAANTLPEEVIRTVTVTSELGEKVFTLTQEAAAVPFESGKYWIVSGDNAAKPISGSYGALECDAVWKSDSNVASTESNVFTFNEVEGGYTIKDSNGKYLYSSKSNSGWYTTFNVSATLPVTGGIWTVDKNSDGSCVIRNTASKQYIQYNTSKASFEHYENAKSGALKTTLVKAEVVMPVLTVTSSLSFAADGETKTITLPDDVTVTASSDNSAFSASVSANVVTVIASAATETRTGVLSMTISHKGFNIVKKVNLTQKVPLPGEVTATITFDNKAKRTLMTTSKAVWEENGITVTNDKASSSSNIADFVKPTRFYANSKLTVAVDGMIYSIVFDCNSNSYATAMKNSIPGSTSASDKVTVELDTPAASFVVQKLGAQVRMDAITVIYVKN